MWGTRCSQVWAEREEGLRPGPAAQGAQEWGEEWCWGTWSSLEEGVDVAFLSSRLAQRAGVSLVGGAEGACSQLSLALWLGYPLLFLDW